MATQKELDGVYMQVAIAHATLSKATRAKVGACLVTKHGVILAGYNGTPSCWPNECEDIVVIAHGEDNGKCYTKTKPEVIHAELNCIMKAAKEGVSVQDATLYVTLQPCLQCSAMLSQAGIRRIVYMDEYRDTSGVDRLAAQGIIIERFVKGNNNETYTS